MLTLAKLRRFVTIRNNSGFNSNLQFQIDCMSAGFQPEELGEVRKFMIDGFCGYAWSLQLRSGNQILSRRLVEFGRGLHLEGEPDEDQMFGLLDRKAVYNEPEKKQEVA